MITFVNFIIATILISFCISVLICCYLYKVLKDEFEDKAGILEEKVHLLEERHFHLEDMYLEHMIKYH
jgi:hypothetical protein